MAQELIIIRGITGAGKSTFARMLLDLHNTAWRLADLRDEDYPVWTHVEADMFFVKDGVYLFDPQKLMEAHSWCQRSVSTALDEGHSVIVSNTFTRIWEMRPYLEMAEKRDIRCTVITIEGNHGNVHNVPEESINKMKARWEKYDA